MHFPLPIPDDSGRTLTAPGLPPEAESGTLTAPHASIPPGTASTVGPRPHRLLGRYDIIRELARGGIGVVYIARDALFDREVAVKLLQPGRTNPVSVRRFHAEARITARLQHPAIPPVFDLGEFRSGEPILVMKLILGRTLAEVLAGPDHPPLIPIFEQICQAVGYAHSRGVIHRDLKPSNIMLGDFGEVQVMDWGLGKELAGQQRESQEDGLDTNVVDTDDGLTHAGSILGTPAYMAPEQARGEPADARADVFGLGGILCVMLTDRPPWADTVEGQTLNGRTPLASSAAEILTRAAKGDIGPARDRIAASDADVVCAIIIFYVSASVIAWLAYQWVVEIIESVRWYMGPNRPSSRVGW